MPDVRVNGNPLELGIDALHRELRSDAVGAAPCFAAGAARIEVRLRPPAD
jgi:hypothetical protein